MADKRKIAFVCHPYHRGGVTRWMADASIIYSQQGHEIYFITVAPVKEFFSAKGKETLLQLLQKEPNKVKVLSEPAGYEFEFGTPAYRALIYKRLIAKLPPGTPLILSDDHCVWEAATYMQGAYPIVGVMHADENFYYALAAKYHSRINVMACVSERVKETTLKSSPAFPQALVFTIPCGIHLQAVSQAEKGTETLQLVFAGRISAYQKRAADLVKIAVALTQKSVRFHLNIIGDGDLKPILEAQIKDAGLQQHVSFTGWLSQKDVSGYLSGADILLLTSDFEGTPIAMMEAFAAGCGMVGTRVSGIEDYEHHALAADCLGVYPVGDIEEAVNKITQLAAVPGDVRRKAARELAELEFSMEVCLNKYNMAMDAITHKVQAAPLISMPYKQLAYSKALAIARYLKVKMMH
jgi:glycosyltransferase involved in cell wall biosynthesis